MFHAHRYLAATIIATAVGLTTLACSPYHSTHRDNGQGRANADRRAFDNGYREGIEHGRRDARDRRSYSYERHAEFRHADQGYRRGYGDRRFYQEQYRAGFERGYAEAFRRDSGRRTGRDR